MDEPLSDGSKNAKKSHGGAKPSFVSSAEKVHLILKGWGYGTQILTELHLHGKLPIKLSVGVKVSTWRRQKRFFSSR